MVFCSNCQSRSQPRWRGDSTKPRQVIINLVGNPIKFTDTGSVRVRAVAEAAISSSLTDSSAFRLVVDVVDTGLGIDTEEQAELFMPYTQRRVGRRAGGTGLGLYLSRRYARAMGGDITVESKPGVGSLFRLDVLLRRSKRDPRTSLCVLGNSPGLSRHARPVRVLVVDHDRDSRTLVAAVLRPLGVEVDEAEGGEQALATIDARPPDAVVLDLMMPAVDGYEPARRIRATPATRSVPIIALSAVCNSDAVDNTDFSDYLLKRMTRNELIEAVGRDPEIDPLDGMDDRRPQVGPVDAADTLPPATRRELLAALEAGDMDRLAERAAALVDEGPEAISAIIAATEQRDFIALRALLNDPAG